MIFEKIPAGPARWPSVHKHQIKAPGRHRISGSRTNLVYMDTDMANSLESYSGQTGDISIYGFGDPVDDDRCFRPLDRYLKSNQELPQDFD